MKYIKSFILLGAAVLLGACSDDKVSMNTAKDVTVSMASTEFSTKESAGIVNVPIKIEGEKNGNVTVTVEVAETGENPAKENVNYYVTTKTINISDNEGYVELEMVDDEEINSARTFTITITKAEGATVGNATTLVSIRDNDSAFYDRLQGNWKFAGVDSDGNAINWDVKITGAADEESKDYNKTLYVTGLCGLGSSEMVLSFFYDEETKEGYVSFDHLGEYAMARNLNFGLENLMNIVPFRFDGKNRINTTPLNGNWSENLKTITFETGVDYLTGVLTDSQTGEQPGYIWFGNGVSCVKDIVMTKK